MEDERRGREVNSNEGPISHILAASSGGLQVCRAFGEPVTVSYDEIRLASLCAAWRSPVSAMLGPRAQAQYESLSYNALFGLKTGLFFLL